MSCFGSYKSFTKSIISCSDSVGNLQSCCCGLEKIEPRILAFEVMAVVNIIFDLGGVVVRWEPKTLISQVFADLEIRRLVYEEFVGHPDWIELDRGTLAPQDAAVRAAQRTGLSQGELLDFLRRVPAALTAIPDTVKLLYSLRSRGHRLYCLSNMQHASIEHLEKAYTFWEVFSGKVISCRLNLCKPEPGIYSHLLDAYQLDPATTLFIDDVDVNLTTARQFGIQTIRFETPHQCTEHLSALGCI
jgi:putative hydrolase of the HAD superfamily